MSEEREIRVDYLARVEGEGSLNVLISEGRVKEVILNIYEAPRFFEAFLVGRKFDEVAEIASRICGICCAAHQITALRAVEDALGITVSQQTKDLRKLLALGGLIQSHTLHVCMLAAPDFFGYESLLSMVPGYKAVIQRALKLKEVGNDLARLVGGRHVHPVTAMLGGFTQIPSEDRLREVRKRLADAKDNAIEIAKLMGAKLMGFPELFSFVRKCEHVALSKPDEYAINEGRLVSTEGLYIDEGEYRKYIKERHEPPSNAKHSLIVGRSTFLVGPLARVNLNLDKLSSDAKGVLEEQDIEFPNFNPFVNNVARAVETVHFIDEAIDGIDSLDLKEENRVSFDVRGGEGHAVTEAPRGILYHNYEFDRNGVVRSAYIVTPTVHNVCNAEEDLWQFVPRFVDLPLSDITLKCEMLIRTYDFCLSCSVHCTKTITKRTTASKSRARSTPKQT